MASCIFFTGLVGAAMKKQVTYNYKIKISSDNGEIINSDCECPAGKGPHGTCKHIAAIMLMLNNFTVNGEIKIQKSCTEGLQQFHAPKRKYEGSPVKAENLNLGAKKKCNLNDPRPKEFINQGSYSSHVRNTVLGYCSITSKDLAMRYLYSKADIQDATKDHDYLTLPFTHYWVDQAIKVDESQIAQIELKTRGQSFTKQWFEERRWRLTASRFGEICKITPKRNKENLCKSLLSNKILTTKPVIHGKQYEQTAAQKFEKIYDINVRKSGFFVRSDYPFLGASPDGLVNDDGIVEIKCPFKGREEKVKPSPNFTFLEYYNNAIQLKTSSRYYMQVQGQLFVAKKAYCYFIVYTFKDLFVQKISFDEEFVRIGMLPKLELFYTKYFRKYIAEHCV